MHRTVARFVSWSAKKMHAHHVFVVGICFFLITGIVYALSFTTLAMSEYVRGETQDAIPAWPLPLNKRNYNDRQLALAHFSLPATLDASSTPPVMPVWTATTSVSVPGKLWPPPAAYPYGGAILPFKRIIAYYGNFYSTKMGVLGEYPREKVLGMLASTTEAWTAADPGTPAVPAIQYIVTVAQASPGKDGMYRFRMPDSEIDKALAMANELGGVLFLDVQVGKSTVQAEIPPLEKYLKMPQVHLALDPEFSMKYGDAPGRVIGTFDAADFNWAAEYLAQLVRENQLPPKILVIHRFTQAMVTNYKRIQPLPEVQFVMDMDGWGPPAKKIGTYTRIVAPEPVQFTGLKIFYHNDLKPPSTGLLTKEEVLSLTPSPIYIQYQ